VDHELNMQGFTASLLLASGFHQNDSLGPLEEDSAQSMAKYPGRDEKRFCCYMVVVEL
jgi:hypothetical protein